MHNHLVQKQRLENKVLPPFHKEQPPIIIITNINRRKLLIIPPAIALAPKFRQARICKAIGFSTIINLSQQLDLTVPKDPYKIGVKSM